MRDYEDDDFWSSRPAEGYSVCAACLPNVDIAHFIKENVQDYECDFCGRKTRVHPNAAPLDGVVDFMAEAINREYDRAVNALGFESAEGGYQGENFDSNELLQDHIGLRLPNDDGRLLEVLVDCFGDELWCHRNPYGVREDELLRFSWEHFCEVIKHERRFFFLKQEQDASHDYLAPSEILKVVSDAAEEHGLVKTLREGSLIYRARQQRYGEVLSTPNDFGPPPVEFATRSNRMSPAGIVMFYGSEDPKTAIAEIDDDPSLGLAVGTFRTTRAALIFDLTALPRAYRFFEVQSDSDPVNRYVLSFLHSFVRSLAARVERVEREHVDYVPTQVVTEYLRSTFRHHGDKPIDGLRYFSAQKKGGTSVVLFADQDDLVLSTSEVKRLVGTGIQESELKWGHEHAWLQMVRKRVIRSLYGPANLT